MASSPNICRDAVARCGECSSIDGCGFCESSLQCLSGDESGPTGAECGSWVFQNTSCPGMSTKLSFELLSLMPDHLSRHIATPNCKTYVDCNSCATQEQCAWCASENLCTTIADSFQRNCRGLVFELPCPTDFVAGTLFDIFAYLSTVLILPLFDICLMLQKT